MDDFADQMCGPVLEDYPGAPKVSMSRDLSWQTPRTIYIQNRGQATITEM